MQTINTNSAQGITIRNGSAYFSLGSPLWIQRTGGPFAKYTYSYAPPGHGWDAGEMATMSMARWGANPKGDWYSAAMRLDMALGFGAYEQSLKVGVGSGVTTTFYLSEETVDKLQEIDFEFSGHCDKPGQLCGTSSVWTNVWWQGNQHPNPTPLWTGSTPPSPMPDTTQGWGEKVYRYKIDWEPNIVSWSVDLTGTGNSYQVIRSEEMSAIGANYDERLCYPFISFWSGWSPDGSPFLKGQDATGKCGDSGACYQAFYFQSLKFTPSPRNQITHIGS